jgi:membrane protein
MTSHHAESASPAAPSAPRRLRRWRARLRLVLRAHPADFARHVVRRFVADDGLRMASGLSYASLLALVPLLAIMLAMISAFPGFDGVREQLLTTLVRDLLPRTDGEVMERLETFVANAGKLTGAGIAGLAVTSLLLLSNINGAFNTIWKVSEPRPVATRVLVYWALLTLGPLLLGASISLSSYVFAAVRLAGTETGAGAVLLTRLLSLALGAAGFALIFAVVPNRRVALAHALAGGAVAAALFEVLKAAFGLYLSLVPGYQAVYGALASVPIFLVWLFACWCVVLLGAEVTAGLPEWKAVRARGHPGGRPGDRLALALALLARLRAAARAGRQLTRGQAVRGLPATPAEVDAVIGPLRAAGFLARSQQGRWLLARDLATARFGELTAALGLALTDADGWPEDVRPAVDALRKSGQPLRDTPVAAFVEASGSTAQRAAAGAP